MASAAVDELQRELRVGAEARPVVAALVSLLAAVDELDPGQLPPRVAVDVVRVLDRVGRVADAGKMAAVGVVAGSNLWMGHRSPALWLANANGGGHGDAIRLMETAEAVEATTVAKDALAHGEVSPRQAKVIAGVEKLSPAQGQELLAKAPRMSLGELETARKRIVAAAMGETESEKRDRIRQHRQLIHGDDGDGTGWGRWQLPMADHVRLLAQLQGLQDQIFTDARTEGRDEPAAAYAVDALCRLGDIAAAKTAATADPAAFKVAGSESDEPVADWSTAKVIVRVDLAALDRGHLEPGERCEIAGRGPVPVADGWRIIDGGAFVAAITTRGTDIDQVVHLGRRPTALQRTALEWHSAGQCEIEGCTSRARIEIDHVADWAHTHVTRVPDLAGPCGHHHDLKTHKGYTFGPRRPDGTRRLIPPGTASGTDPSTRTNGTGAPGNDPAETGQGDLFDTG